MDQVLSYAAAARSSKQAPSTNKHFPPGILMTPKTIAENLKSIKEATKALNKPVQKLNKVVDKVLPALTASTPLVLKRAPRTLLKSFAVSKELETVYEKYKIKDGTNSSINFRWEEPRVGLVNEVQIKNVNEVESVADKTLPDIARIKDKTLADIARIKVAETELDTKVARVVSVNVKVPKQQSEISQVKKALIAKKVDPVNKEDKKHKVQIKNGKNFFAAAFKVTETLQEKVCMLSSMQSKAFKVLDLKEDLKEEWTVVVRRNRSRTGRIMRI